MGCIAAQAQPPNMQDGPPPRGESSADAFVARMMAFDDNHDGKLTRAEVTDERLLGLFDRADANHDGIVTKDELKALFTKESAGFGGGGGGPRGGGRGGPGGGPGGFGGRGGGFGMMAQPGQILSEPMQQMLTLTPQQRSALADLQKDVDSKLDRILTPAQKTQMKELGPRGPGGPPRGPDQGRP